MDTQQDENIIYREIQRNQWWLRLLSIFAAIAVILPVCHHLFFSGNYGVSPSRDFYLILIGIIVGIILPIIGHTGLVKIEVSRSSINYYSDFPFLKSKHEISLENISEYEIRPNNLFRITRSYNGFSNRGILITYLNGESAFVVSINPEKLIDAIDQIKKRADGKYFYRTLSRIQPTQLYINAEELAQAIIHLKHDEPFPIDPIPIKKINDMEIFTGDNTPAFAAYFLSIPQVKVYWDEDDVDLEELETRIKWCKEQNIRTISDLKRRVVPNDKYEKLWLKKLKELK